MAEERSGRRGGAGAGGRKNDGSARGSRGASGRSGNPDATSSRGGSSRGDAKPRRGGPAAGDAKPRRGGPAAGDAKPRRGGSSRDERSWTRQRPGARERTPEERTADQQIYDGPPLPEEITGEELDHNVRAQLKSLPDKLALRVARHLAAAGAVLDEDPELALRHTLAARARAARLAIVREAVGEAAYAAGKYDVALAELRAAKRINGATEYLPMMADCHRALGQPEQALKLAKSPSVANFPSDLRAEMVIVEAGARRDMGQFEAALTTLERAPLTSKSREPWVVRLRYSYADTLEAAGRLTDALAWFHRTHAIDGDELTDADARATALEKRVPD